jgi:hypothetical protein
MQKAFAVSVKYRFSGMRAGWKETPRIVRAWVWIIRSYSVDKMDDNRRNRADWSIINLPVAQQAIEAKGDTANPIWRRHRH